MDDAVILERSGVRILVVGVTAGGWLNVFYELFRMYVKDPEEEIRRVLADYEEFDYDLLVVLSHLGVEKDKEIASHFHSVNVIVGGHSHSLLEKPLVEHNVIICQAGQFGEYLGELVVDFDVGKRKAIHFDGRLIPAKDYSLHPKIVKLIERHSKLADRNLSRKLYSISVSLDHSLTKENAIGNFLADALKDMLKTEIGIINSGVFNGGIGKGAVTRKLLHQLCPSPLNPTYMEVKGADLQAALEKSLRKELQLGDGRGPSSRTRYLGNIQVSRNVQVKVNSGVIESITVEGQALEPERWYSVGTSDFLQRGAGYSELTNNRNERHRVEFLRDVLQTYLQKKSFLNKTFQRRFITE